jgi:hypothetical protein
MKRIETCIILRILGNEEKNMKKCTAIFAVLALSIGLLTGCGDTYEATESTVFVQKDGTILSTDIESFDPGSYDESGLRTYVEEAISDYTEEHGSGTVKLKDLSFADGVATLSIEYASVNDYSEFNGIELFTGSIAEALAAGYSFDGEYYDFSDGNQSLCDASAFLDTDGYKVVIIKANTDVHVNGKVKFASVQNVSLVDNSTVAISNANNSTDDTLAEDTESTETETEEDTVDAMTTETAGTDEGSIDDDDFVLEEETETEVVFEFEEQERPQTEDSVSLNSSYTNVYTYIIYK